MDIDGLRKLFGRALGFTLASPMVLGGCSGAGQTTPPDVDSSYSEVPCGSQLDALKPPVIPDLVEYWQIQGVVPSHVRVDSHGVPCATATDAGGCSAELKALKPDAGMGRHSVGMPGPYDVESYFLTTRGDDVRAITTFSELNTFLGLIDVPQEAVLLGRVNGFGIECGNRQRGAFRVTDGGIEIVSVNGYSCSGGTVTRSYRLVSSDGKINTIKSEDFEKPSPGLVCGRRPHGMVAKHTRRAPHPLGQHFAQSAQLEASSVAAFQLLRSDLEFHGAPEALQCEASDAAHDEVRHTNTTTALARRFGAEPACPQVERGPQRPLLAIAIENAVEGCLRETWGAVVGHHQSVHALDPHVRRAMRVIAEDETRHAALSWKVHAWASTQLTADEQREVWKAQKEALATLREEVTQASTEAWVKEAGLPDAARAASMLQQLATELWA